MIFLDVVEHACPVVDQACWFVLIRHSDYALVDPAHTPIHDTYTVRQRAIGICKEGKIVFFSVKMNN